MCAGHADQRLAAQGSCRQDLPTGRKQLDAVAACRVLPDQATPVAALCTVAGRQRMAHLRRLPECDAAPTALRSSTCIVATATTHVPLLSARTAYIVLCMRHSQHVLSQIDKAPQLIRPNSCLPSGSQLRDAVKEPQVTSWIPTCQAAQDSCSNTTNSTQPWLKCEYKSLSTFWEIQRHIRNHGAVISRWA